MEPCRTLAGRRLRGASCDLTIDEDSMLSKILRAQWCGEVLPGMAIAYSRDAVRQKHGSRGDGYATTLRLRGSMRGMVEHLAEHADR